MKTGYSFGSLVSFTEALNAAAVKITGDQTIAGLKTFSSNPITSASQGSGGSHLTRKDYVDGELALKAPLSSPALTGTPTAPTAAAGTDTTQVATTAFVTASNTAQLATVTPLMNGTATVGASTLVARQDHVHPIDTSRAPLASPTFTGIPAAPTAVAGTDTTQIATTAFVTASNTAQIGTDTPLMSGTAAVGVSVLLARQDHRHPTDTTRAPLASPALTGTPTAPTAAEGTNTTQIATTAFVQSTAASIVTAKASSTTPLMDGTATAGTSTNYAREDHVHPTDTSRAPLASPALTGTPTAPTAAAGTNTTQIATTAFVQSAASGSSFRNKIVDGRFDFWYEGTSQKTSGYGSSTMWSNINTSADKITQRVVLSPSDLPAIDNPTARYASLTTVTAVTGYPFHYVRQWQRIEDAHTLAGKKAVLSFYAKASIAGQLLGVAIQQNFGIGGSPSPTADVIGTSVPLTTQWVRYQVPVDMPSVIGKTFGTTGNVSGINIIFGFSQGSNFAGTMGGLDGQQAAFTLACIQLEEGEQATKFEELPIAIVENLVGRYYETNYPYDTPVGTPNATGGYRGFTHPKATGMTYGAATQFRVPKQAIPKVVIYNNVTGAKDRVYAGGGLVEVFTVNDVGKNGFVSLGVTTLTANIDVSFYYVADARL